MALKGNKYARSRRSKKARETAHDIADQASKGLQLNLYQTLRDHGYSYWMARRPKKVTSTKSFQEEVQNSGVLDVMIENHTLATALLNDSLKGKYHRGVLLRPADLATICKTIAHDIQLLTGADTDRIKTDVGNLKSIGDVVKDLRKELHLK